MKGHGNKAGMTLRKLAELKGQITHHGKRCGVCEKSERYVSNDKCYTCQKSRNSAPRKPPMIAEKELRLVRIFNSAFKAVKNGKA